MRAIPLLNKKYEITEQKQMQMLVVRKNLFFTTDMDKNVRPRDKRE